MYNIYFGNRRIVLSDNIDQTIFGNDIKAILKYSTPNELRQFVDNFVKREHLTIGCVYFHDIEILLQQFKTLFARNIEAAGGVVYNPQNEILVIKRLGVYDFPKGKAEAGETPEQTALREVNEECGIEGLKITGKITDTYHTYNIGNDLVLKCTHWFKMSIDNNQTPKPQTEENITAAEWLAESKKDEVLSNTYASIAEMVSCI